MTWLERRATGRRIVQMWIRVLMFVSLSGSLWLATPSSAHHSFAMFDLQNERSVTGAITKFEFVNPHTLTHLYALDNSGKGWEWVFEGVSTGVLFRAGWRPDTLKPGDKVTIYFAPLKDGAHGGMFLRAKLANGVIIHNVDILKGSPFYKPENEEEQRNSVATLKKLVDKSK